MTTLYFNGGKDRDDYNRFEGVFSLGGYIIKDKLWFFGSVNPIYNQTVAQRNFGAARRPDSVRELQDQEQRPGRVGPAHGRPGRRPAPVGHLHQQFHQVPGRPARPSSATAPRTTNGSRRGMTTRT